MYAKKTRAKKKHSEEFDVTNLNILAKTLSSSLDLDIAFYFYLVPIEVFQLRSNLLQKSLLQIEHIKMVSPISGSSWRYSCGQLVPSIKSG